MRAVEDRRWGQTRGSRRECWAAAREACRSVSHKGRQASLRTGGRIPHPPSTQRGRLRRRQTFASCWRAAAAAAAAAASAALPAALPAAAAAAAAARAREQLPPAALLPAPRASCGRQPWTPHQRAGQMSPPHLQYQPGPLSQDACPPASPAPPPLPTCTAPDTAPDPFLALGNPKHRTPQQTKTLAPHMYSPWYCSRLCAAAAVPVSASSLASSTSTGR